jgi:gliding motility-associated-like protein
VDTRTIFLPERVAVFPKPVAQFTVHPAEVSLLDPVVTLTDYAEGASMWSYSIGDGPMFGDSIQYTFADAGQYEITQTVTSGANCTDAITVPVFVSDHLFHAPSAFTPDGDGVNDEFLPVVKGARLYEMVIMDRWGTERFRTTDPTKGWDGVGLPQGVYTYLVRLAEFGAFRKEYRGHFTLLR